MASKSSSFKKKLQRKVEEFNQEQRDGVNSEILHSTAGIVLKRCGFRVIEASPPPDGHPLMNAKRFSWMIPPITEWVCGCVFPHLQAVSRWLKYKKYRKKDYKREVNVSIICLIQGHYV